MYGNFYTLEDKGYRGTQHVACEYNRVSLLFAARDVSPGGTSVALHIDDVKQCLHNKIYIHGVPDVNFFDFMFLLVKNSKVLCSTENELQQNFFFLIEEYIP